MMKRPRRVSFAPSHPETECQLSLTSAQGHGIITEASSGTVNDTVFSLSPSDACMTGSKVGLVKPGQEVRGGQKNSTADVNSNLAPGQMMLSLKDFFFFNK